MTTAKEILENTKGYKLSNCPGRCLLPNPVALICSTVNFIDVGLGEVVHVDMVVISGRLAGSVHFQEKRGWWSPEFFSIIVERQ